MFGLCIALFESTPRVDSIVCILLYLIIDFNYAYQFAGVLGKRGRGGATRLGFGDSESVADRVAAFWRFGERHRRILNVFVRNNPELLNGAFAAMVHEPLPLIVALTFFYA